MLWIFHNCSKKLALLLIYSCWPLGCQRCQEGARLTRTRRSEAKWWNGGFLDDLWFQWNMVNMGQIWGRSVNSKGLEDISILWMVLCLLMFLKAWRFRDGWFVVEGNTRMVKVSTSVFKICFHCREGLFGANACCSQCWCYEDRDTLVDEIKMWLDFQIFFKKLKFVAKVV